MSSNDVFFFPRFCVSVFLKTGVERKTNSEEVKHDCLGTSVVFLMWCSVVITEITKTWKNTHCSLVRLFLFVIDSSSFIFKREKMLASAPVPDASVAQTRAGQKLSDEKEVLRKENVNLMQRQKELELKVQELKCELQVCGKAKMLLSFLCFCQCFCLYGFIVLQFICVLLFGVEND